MAEILLKSQFVYHFQRSHEQLTHHKFIKAPNQIAFVFCIARSVNIDRQANFGKCSVINKHLSVLKNHLIIGQDYLCFSLISPVFLCFSLVTIWEEHLPESTKNGPNN